MVTEGSWWVFIIALSVARGAGSAMHFVFLHRTRSQCRAQLSPTTTVWHLRVNRGKNEWQKCCSAGYFYSRVLSTPQRKRSEEKVWEELCGQDEVLQPQSEIPCSLWPLCWHFWCPLCRESHQTRQAHCSLCRAQLWQVYVTIKAHMSWQRLQPPKSLCCNRSTLKNCSDGFNLCWSTWKQEEKVAELNRA